MAHALGHQAQQRAVDPVRLRSRTDPSHWRRNTIIFFRKLIFLEKFKFLRKFLGVYKIGQSEVNKEVVVVHTSNLKLYLCLETPRHSGINNPLLLSKTQSRIFLINWLSFYFCLISTNVGKTPKLMRLRCIDRNFHTTMNRLR